MTAINKSLHWTQRVALIRHNLHTASRSGDFSFFKHLQAQGFREGTNHVAILSATLGDEADSVLSALDDFNAAIAHAHEDAFKNVYDSLKNCLSDQPDGNVTECRSKIYVDTTMQKQMADMTIDKMTNSAIALIQQQPVYVQDTTAGVWIEGATIVADCVEISLKQMDALENNMTDFIRLENSWASVRNSTVCAITALRGIYNLMDMSETGSEAASSRRGSLALTTSGVFRRLSNAFTPTSPARSRSSSIAYADARSSIGNITGFEFKPVSFRRSSTHSTSPDKPADKGAFKHTDLSPIPPTPATHDDSVNPFDISMAPPLPEDSLQRMEDAVMI